MSLLLMKKLKNRTGARTSASLPSMNVIGSAQPDVMKIKVYKSISNGSDPGYEPGSSKKLCIDPHIVSYRTIQCLIAQAFDIKSDFTISAVQRCITTGIEKLTSVWCDLELETAIRNVKSGSYLRLRCELTPREESLDDWDFVDFNDVSSNIRCFNVDDRSIIATVNSTAGKKQPSALNKAINWMYGGHDRQNSKPVGENDFKKFLDSEGRLKHIHELRQAIYESGVEPSFRKVIWRHLLNIFPANMTSAERNNYLKDVSITYEKLKGRWRKESNHSDHTRAVMRAIQIDVLRTDRTFGFYATSGDTNLNLQSLYHILITYCVSHPTVTYRQGMNEYASTLLYVMRDESLAYLCFCSIMKRLEATFATDGVAIATKFHHLKVLLQAVDPVYWNFLESCDAVSLFFTYRWLLLECKREFPFNDALRVLEVMWATLPFDNEPTLLSKLPDLPSLADSPIRDIPCSTPFRAPSRRALSCPQLSVIDESNSRKNRQHSYSVTVCNNTEFYSFGLKPDHTPTSESDEDQLSSSTNKTSNSTFRKSREKSFENSYSLSEISEFDSDSLSTYSNSNSKCINTTAQCPSSTNWVQRLSANSTIWLEEDNSFLLFLCISIFLAHRTHLLKQKNLDAQEISMHFDRFRRRHNAEKLLSCARSLYAQYLQWARKKRMHDEMESFSAS